MDIDSANKPNLLRVYAKATKYGKTRVTKTANGFHLRISSSIEDIWEIQNIRKLLGDDPKRLEHDKILIEMGHPELANRLFERKRRLSDNKWVYEKPFRVEV